MLCSRVRRFKIYKDLVDNLFYLSAVLGTAFVLGTRSWRNLFGQVACKRVYWLVKGYTGLIFEEIVGAFDHGVACVRCIKHMGVEEGRLYCDR